MQYKVKLTNHIWDFKIAIYLFYFYFMFSVTIIGGLVFLLFALSALFINPVEEV